MTFRESEFPNLLSQIDSVARNYPPDALSEYIQEMARIYRAIPLYPGLVCMCMGKSFEPIAADAPAPAKGSYLVVRRKGGSDAVFGKLFSWTTAAIQIDCRDPRGKVSRQEILRRHIQSIERFRKDTLETFWPTLVFDRKSASAKRPAR